jgi:hypothetical protein
MRFAIQQRINATWVLKYKTPRDGINKTRKLVGDPPEIIILEHMRDDNYYDKGTLLYDTVETEMNGSRRIVIAVDFKRINKNMRIVKAYTCPVRNQAHVFDYTPNKKLEVN